MTNKTTAKLTKKNIGDTITFAGFNDYSDRTFTGKIISVRNGLAVIEYQFKGETYNTCLEVNHAHIITVEHIIGYTLSSDEIKQYAQA